MQDLQNYQYYDPSPVAPPVPWWKRKRTWQLAGLVTLAIVVLVFASVAATNALKNRRLANQGTDLMQQANALESRLSAECDEGDTACLDLARADAARSLGLVQACDELEGDAYQHCVSLIAVDKANPQVCDVLSGQDRSNCADTPYLLQATAEMNVSLCDKIVATGTRAACTTQVRAAIVAANACASAGLDQALCDAATALADAIASNDPAKCAALNENDAYACEQAQQIADADQDGLVALDEKAFGTSEGVADTDGDGLSDGDEVHVYATDPAKADTDGDGYSDGTEVDSGYDPLK